MNHPYPLGTRVQKINSEAGLDGHTDGALATVLGHVGPVPEADLSIGYFVRWDDMPDNWVAITADRVRAIDDQGPAHVVAARRFIAGYPGLRFILRRWNERNP